MSPQAMSDGHPPEVGSCPSEQSAVSISEKKEKLKHENLFRLETINYLCQKPQLLAIRNIFPTIFSEKYFTTIIYFVMSFSDGQLVSEV